MKFNRVKYLFCSIIITMLLSLTMSIGLNAKDYNGNKLKAKYKAFLKNPGNWEQQELLKVLPNKRATIDKHQVLDYIFMNLLPLEELAQQGNPTAMNILFKIIYLTDGAYTSQLNIILGATITSHPEVFLKTLAKNQQLIVKYEMIDSLLGNLGTEFVDELEKSLIELERRYLAIRQTKNVPEKIKSLCLYELSKQIYEDRRYQIEMNGYHEIAK